MSRVKITLDLHPEDYKHVQEGAKAQRIPEPEFCALAIHKGAAVLRDFRRDWLDDEPPPEQVGVGRNGDTEHPS